MNRIRLLNQRMKNTSKCSSLIKAQHETATHCPDFQFKDNAQREDQIKTYALLLFKLL